MKILDIIKKIVLILSFVVCAVAFVFGAITLDQNDAVFSTGLISFIVLGMVGILLFFSKNEIAKKIGIGISTGVMLIQLYFAIGLIDSGSVAAILGLVSVVLYAIYFLIALIGTLALGNGSCEDPETDPRIKKILGWKKLQNEGIISAEEFEEKRQEILGFKSKNNKK